MLRSHGGAYTAPEAAARLGVDHPKVEQQHRTGHLIAVRLGQEDWLYPAFQFTGGGIRPGLDEVLAELHLSDDWSKVNFFLSGDPRIDGCEPAALLRAGRIAEVKRAAAAYGEHGAA